MEILNIKEMKKQSRIEILKEKIKTKSYLKCKCGGDLVYRTIATSLGYDRFFVCNNNDFLSF